MRILLVTKSFKAVIDLEFNSQGKSLYSAALAAAAAGKNVGFGLKGCKNDPKIPPRYCLYWLRQLNNDVCYTFEKCPVLNSIKLYTKWRM